MRIFASLAFVTAATLAVVTLALGAGATGCSSSSDSAASAEGCASSPFSCAAGQTCAAKDASGAFACLPSGSGAKGSPCLNTPGMTTCGDGLTCLQLVQSGGTCTSYCDTAHPCATGETCSAAGIAGTSTVFHVCAGGAAPTVDAGSKDAAAE